MSNAQEMATLPTSPKLKMSSTTMQARPLSPPHSIDGDLALNESKSLFLREPFTPPRSIRPALTADTTLVSPPPTYHEVQCKAEENLPVQDLYGDPTLYQTAPTHHYYPMQPVSNEESGAGVTWAPAHTSQTYVTKMEYHTPPPILTENGIHTRSGRALRSPSRPGNADYTRHPRSPRLRKTPKNARAGKSKTPLIEQPLSVLTAEYQIPLKDMHAWVHRPVEQRMQEVENKKGYISRPMNSFMLYRSAYADRVKKFCKENNHQVVSQVTGASWPLEPKNVREMYEQYAMIERENHHSAHPDYKFAPNKNGKKRAQADDEVSDDDPDWEGSSRSAKRSRTSRRGDIRSQSSTPFEVERIPRHHIPQYHQPMMHHSSYQAINPHGPAPMMIGPDGLVGHYYQTTVMPYGQNVDDVKFGMMDNPFQHYDPITSLVGLPSGTRQELLGSNPLTAGQVQMHGDMLDPRLSQNDPNQQYQQYEQVDPAYGMPQHYEYGAYTTQPGLQYPQDGKYHPGMATLTDGSGLWAEPEQVGSAFDEEFQRWT